MKSIIIYASVHHGNTRKLVDALAKEFDIETLDATQIKEKDLSSYDLIGFASGIYAGQFHQAIKNFARINLPRNKPVFFLMTSAMNRDFSSSMNDPLKGKDAQILGCYSCSGYNTFGPFKLIGGTAKGHPDSEDIRKAVGFYQEIILKCNRIQPII